MIYLRLKSVFFHKNKQNPKKEVIIIKKTLLFGPILAVFISVNAWANGETEYMESFDGKIYQNSFHFRKSSILQKI